MKNWDDVRIFLAVAQEGSLSRAAPRARMDPATLSRRISRLEREVGQPLFIKSPQGYILTRAGQALQTRAAQAEESLAAPIDRGADEELSGQVRIGAPDGCANFLLPEVCAALQAEHPKLEVQILAVPRVVNLSKREADVAITLSPPQTNRLSSRVIADYTLHLAARTDIAARITTLEQLAAQPAVGYISDMIFDRELDYLSGLPIPPVRLASNSASVQVQLLRAGGGVGFVHDFAMPFAPELRPVLRRELSLRRRFYLVHHTVDQKSHRMQRLIERLCIGLRKTLLCLEDRARDLSPAD